MIDEDFEEPVISRSMRSSGFSFGISVVVHLALFLTLALVLFTSNKQKSMTLDVATVDNFSDMLIDDEPLFQMDSPESAVEMNEEELVLDDDAPLEFESDTLVNFSALLDDTHEFSEQTEIENRMEVFQIAPTKGFFGIEATGNRIIYIIDNSPSMAQGYLKRRFDRAVDEVLNSVDQLQPEQEFFVFVFSFSYIPMDLIGEGKFCLPTNSNKAALESWLRSVRLGSGTDPREALVSALAMNPSCCFLLSDGEFNGRKFGTGKYGKKSTAVSLARRNNLGNSPIHTIGLEDEGNQKDMNKIAAESGGVYKFIPAQGGR